MDGILGKEENPTNFNSENCSEERAVDEEITSLKDCLLGTPGTITLQESLAGETITEDAEDKVIKFNVGGRLFMTRSSTLHKTGDNTSGIKLGDPDFLSDKYDASRDEYFLDRDPEVFACVLNFLRSGQLHLPSTLCGPHVNQELTYWGVSPLYIEPCCWQTFNSWTSVMASLKRLERDSKLGVTTTNRDGSCRRGQGGEEDRQVSRCQRCRCHVWNTLTNPDYSLLAKIYGWVALFFIILAIFSFSAATHMAFRVPITVPATTVTPQSQAANVTPTTSSPTQEPSHKTVEDRLSETEVHPILTYLDYICLVFFTTEFLMKFVCSPSRWRYLRSINGIVDLLALCPDYVELIVMAVDPNHLQGDSFFLLFLPFLRIMRVFRIFRLVQHVPGLWVMVYTLQASYKELFLMLAVLFVGTLFFASVIFFVDDKEMFPSIPQGFWWAIVTMTTVGYGDMYPVTSWGYVLGSMTAVSGVLMIGFTVPALVSNFSLYYNHVQFALHREKLQKDLEREKEEEEKAKMADRRGTVKDLNGRKMVHETIQLREMKNSHHSWGGRVEGGMDKMKNGMKEETMDEKGRRREE